MARPDHAEMTMCALRGRRTLSLPSYGSTAFAELELELEDEELDRYERLAAKVLGATASTPPSQLVGHAACEIDDPGESAAITVGLTGQLRGTAWRRKHATAIAAERNEWTLLFRMESAPRLGLNFWDAGCLQIMIRRDALAGRDFTRTCASIATS